MDEGEKDEFHVSMLATLPKARGKGVGTKLLKFAERLAINDGFDKISLTVVQDNKKALSVYKIRFFDCRRNQSIAILFI